MLIQGPALQANISVKSEVNLRDFSAKVEMTIVDIKKFRITKLFYSV